MTNREFYQWLLDGNATLTLRWYDDFGNVNISDFSKDRKFQEVHIKEVDADVAYDIAYNGMSVIYAIEEDFEEIMKEALEVQRKYYNDRGLRYIPFITNVFVRYGKEPCGETFFIKE